MLIDSTLVTELNGVEEIDFIQQHSVVEVPFMVGKRWDIKRFQLGLRVGPSIQFNTTVDGYYLSDGTLLQRDAAVKSMSMYLRSEGHIGYTLTDHWGIYMSVGARWGLTPFLQDNRVSQRKNQRFLSGGISYRF